MISVTQQVKSLERTADQESVKPLADDAFAALMALFALPEQTSVALAVSGGPDSMALAWCVKRWARDRTVRALIVDHQLRPESSEEAEAVRQRLMAIGIDTEILRWEHPPIKSRVHSVARKARYDLLLAACLRHNISSLLPAHQREDQAETILMRFAKGSGLDGLAGIAPVKEIGGVRLLRPFLSVSKKTLIATCAAAGLIYITDPSNSAEKYARGRLRRVEGLLADEGFSADRLVDIGDRAREAKEALDHYTQSLLRVAARMDAAGTIQFNLEQLCSAPRAVASRALSECLCTIHPTDYPPERAALLSVLEALCGEEVYGARTIHGCLLNKKLSEVTLIRELAAITDVKSIVPGETVSWDGRWNVTLSAQCENRNLVVKALGVQTHDVLDRLSPDLRRKVSQGRARAVLPALWEKDHLVFIPDFFSITERGEAFAVVLTNKNIPSC